MRQQRTIGAIVKVPLEDGFHTYARTLSDAAFAFYDSRTKEDITDLNEIISRPVLFIIGVYNSAVTKGRWLKLGKVPLESKFDTLPLQFIQDALDPTRFKIYDNGIIRNATREECVGLERTAVWEAEHVEERLNDHYAGRTNRWVESLRMK